MSTLTWKIVMAGLYFVWNEAGLDTVPLQGGTHLQRRTYRLAEAAGPLIRIQSLF